MLWFYFFVSYIFLGGDQKNGPIPQENLAHCQKLVKSVVHFLSFPFVFLSFPTQNLLSDGNPQTSFLDV